MHGKLVICVVIGVVGVIAYFGWKLTARGAYETAEYAVLLKDGPFEIREYSPLMLVTTGMRFESQGDDGSFMRLFRYISGANQPQQKIAMTTPVFMEDTVDAGQGQMGFVLPKRVTEQGIPEPTADNVQIRTRSGGRFAVIRFAGRITRESVSDAERALLTWVDDQGLTADGHREVAGYDPPWTPGPLRRNEVLVRLR
jgi:hypothetical protein